MSLSSFLLVNIFLSVSYHAPMKHLVFLFIYIILLHILCNDVFQSGLVNIMCGYGAQELPVSVILVHFTWFYGPHGTEIQSDCIL